MGTKAEMKKWRRKLKQYRCLECKCHPCREFLKWPELCKKYSRKWCKWLWRNIKELVMSKEPENLIKKFILENGIATEEEIEAQELPDWMFPCGKQKVSKFPNYNKPPTVAPTDREFIKKMRAAMANTKFKTTPQKMYFCGTKRAAKKFIKRLSKYI